MFTSFNGLWTCTSFFPITPAFAFWGTHSFIYSSLVPSPSGTGPAQHHGLHVCEVNKGEGLEVSDFGKSVHTLRCDNPMETLGVLRALSLLQM